MVIQYGSTMSLSKKYNNIAMKLLNTFLALAAVSVVFFSCKSSNPTQAVNTSDTGFLLNHFLFQQGGKPSLGGWTFHPAQPDDTLDFEMDTPPGDGTWSFKLHTSEIGRASCRERV